MRDPDYRPGVRVPDAPCRKDYMYPAEHESIEHPFRAEVKVDREWATNALTFATAEDARAYGRDLLDRWFVPTDSRVVDTRTGEVVA